ncbi:MAG: glycosyltransferase family 4 protein [Pseudolabrys sp.]
MTQKILYLVSEDWYFVSHRLPMARAARGAGYDVHVATRIGDCAERIRGEGFELHPISWRRGSMNPFRLIAAVVETRRLYRRIQPDLAHHVAFLPTVIGSIAALGLDIRVLNAFTGLGFTFASKTPTARSLRLLVVAFLGWLLKRPGTTVLVQNPDDRAAIEKLGVGNDKIALIAGSGVDTDAFKPLPEPPPPVIAGFVGRLLADKGVPTLVDAHQLLVRRGHPVALLIAGEPDPANPASIPPATIAEWKQRPGLSLLGQVDDIAAFWAGAHIAVLPSLREGLPMSLLEAAACARPIVATNVPGCREIARDGVNALLVPPNDAQALADAIDRLANDAQLRRRFGAAGRRIVEDEYSHVRIGQEIVALYGRLLSQRPGARSLLRAPGAPG